MLQDDGDMSMINLTKESFEQEVLAAKVPVIIDFWANWCEPCSMQAGVLEEVEKELGDRIKICKVDVDAQAALALDYRITSIPTLVFMYQGMFQSRTIGLQTKEMIEDRLNTLLDGC